MKLNGMFRQEQVITSVGQRENIRLFSNVMASKKYSCTEAEKDSVYKLLDTRERFGKILLVSFDEIKDAQNYRGEKSQDTVFATVSEEKAFPTIKIYIPSLGKSAQEERERNQRNINYRRIQAMLAKSRVTEPREMQAFAMNVLPLKFPENLHLDSSFVRGRKLATQDGAVVYGDINSELFAVEYNWFTERHLTVFLPGIKYHEIFETYLRGPNVGLSDEDAYTISRALPHDAFYYVTRKNVFNNAVLYSSAIVKLLGFPTVGSMVEDVINGPTLVFSAEGKLFVDIDDELLSVFVIDNALYIYVPERKQND